MRPQILSSFVGFLARGVDSCGLYIRTFPIALEQGPDLIDLQRPLEGELSWFGPKQNDYWITPEIDKF